MLVFFGKNFKNVLLTQIADNISVHMCKQIMQKVPKCIVGNTRNKLSVSL